MSLSQAISGIGWSALTILLYLAAKRIHRRWHHWWTMPLAVTPVALLAVAAAVHLSYAEYHQDTGWLVALLGPATVAFAVPIWEQRKLIAKHWPVLLIGVLVGSTTAIATSFGLASLLGLNQVLRLSLLPRSISTPFAMSVSTDLGGSPDLTAVFVVLTGVIGAIVGESLIVRLPLRSGLAKGALLGMGAHGSGTAVAHQVGRTEGAVAGLTMVLTGVANVLAAPLLALFLG
jgi:predicted murein hydrolase (TIGR00659 family)